MLESLTQIWSTQVMRKKSDIVAVVSNKTIAKPTKVRCTNTRDRTTKRTVTAITQQPVFAPRSPLPMSHEHAKGNMAGSVLEQTGDTCDDRYSDTGSRDRSVTPIESDLLKYLTAHITPPVQGGFTSFVISREEYLQGIVELVKSDCPEVVQDMSFFMEAMQQAFKDTNHVTHG
jgi:hypothetical protein